MSTPKWWQGPLLGYDCETTGTSVFTDRIVTAAVVARIPGSRPQTVQWIINPGIDIPDEAAAVHGWTNDRLDEHLAGHQAARIVNGHTRPLPREAALNEIAAKVAMSMGQGIPVIAANAPFDLTLLDAELTRHGIDPLTVRPAGVVGVIDPMVLEKQFDPYRKVNYPDGNGCRKGKHACGGCGATDKTLTSLCRHYGVPLTAAHDAAADALAAVRLAPRLMELWPDAARLRLATLHAHQVTWRREQADGLRAYFDKNGIEHDGVCGEWPVHVGCRDSKGAAA